MDRDECTVVAGQLLLENCSGPRSWERRVLVLDSSKRQHLTRPEGAGNEDPLYLPTYIVPLWRVLHCQEEVVWEASLANQSYDALC